MKKSTLKSVCRYIGLCMIGTLISAAYVSYAHADICFLPGNSCFQSGDNPSCDTSCNCVGANCCPSEECRISVCDGVVVSDSIIGRVCNLMTDSINYCCHNSCMNGYVMYNGRCIPECSPNCPFNDVEGTCVPKQGYEICQGKCLPKQQTGHRELQCPNYVCEQGYEMVPGLDGCFAKCSASGQHHNSSTGECECVSTQEVCGNSCVDKCPVGKVLDTDTCTCVDSLPDCESPKEFLTTINNVKTCADCRDYVLRDGYCGGDIYSYGYLDSYSYPSESCSQVTTSGRFVRDVQNASGYCNRCPIPRSNPTTQAKNRYKCYFGNMEVTNYADLCYALGYTYNVSGSTCSSPFTVTTMDSIRQYNSDISYVQSTLNRLNALGTSGFEASPCSVCPFDSRFYSCPFKCTYFTEAQMNLGSGYSCVQCPGRHLTEGNDGYFCARQCPVGQTWDENLHECVSMCQGYKELDPADVCVSASACGLQTPENILNDGGYDYSMSSGYDGGYEGPHTCRVLGIPYPVYSLVEAAKLRKHGYYCIEIHDYACPGMYDCQPVKPLATAVRENSGTCAECGSNPKKYQCSIGNVTIDKPYDLCDYLGFTIIQLDYWSYFDGRDGVASCQGMACGVRGNQLGLVGPVMYYKCQCRAGYTMTSTGCQKTEPDCPDGYEDGISGCIPDPDDPCDGYSTVLCPSATHQCTQSIPGCGCIQCQEAPGVYCNQGEVCSVALNTWGKCEGTCVCNGVTCTNDKVCANLNPCGLCPSESSCICPGTECSGAEFCNGETNQCGNCTSNCEAKTCSTYGYQESDTCSNSHKKAQKVDASLTGGLTCYECVYKTCNDYGYKSEQTGCAHGYDPQTPRPGLTCYSCTACTETCYGERYRFNLTCASEHQLSCTNCDNETRYYCDSYSGDGYSGDGYSADGYSADGYSDSGSNYCNCDNVKCRESDCHKACDNSTSTYGILGAKTCVCKIEGVGCDTECCACEDQSTDPACTSTPHCRDEKHCGDNP